MAGPKRRAFRSRLIFRAVTLISVVGQTLPLPIGRAAGRALGTVAWHVARRERKKALANIAIAFPDWPPERRRSTIRSMFRHLGMSLFEIGWLPNLAMNHLAKTTSVEGLDRVVEQIAAGRSVVIFTAHCGNWEWLGYTAGLHAPVTAIQRERSEEGMDDFLRGLRARAGIRTIDRGSAGAARELIQGLRKPGILAFLIDQNIRAENTKVPFFGRPALTPIGPAKLAIRGGALVGCAFIERGADGLHYVRFHELLETSRDDDPVELTARMTAAIEDQIRRVPEQWVWMHDRWRERGGG